MVLLILTLTFLTALVAGIVISIVRRSENWYTATSFIAICWIILGLILAVRGVFTVPSGDMCRVTDVKLPERVDQAVLITCEFGSDLSHDRFKREYARRAADIPGFDVECQSEGRDCQCLFVDRHFWLGEYSLQSVPCPKKYGLPYQPPAEQP